LLLHGFTSRKERMADGIGRALLRRGVASLAIDLPLHGGREGRFDDVSLRNPMQVVSMWRLAVREAREALGYLAELRQVDAGRVAIVGYSLGSFLGVTIAAAEPRVRAVVLVAGGDYPEQTPFASLIRTVADPLRSVRKLAGRPLLMVNGRFDRTVRPEQAERLFAAAAEPKEMRWYQGGHWPGATEIEAVALWLEKAWSSDARKASAGRS
jgi:pimeloyl-ACP methyl ester carboxylesterase